MLWLSKMKVLFWLRKNKTNARGEAPIYCRITVDGIRAQDFSTGLMVRIAEWNSKKQSCRNEIINARLRSIRDKLDFIFLDLDRNGVIPTSYEVKNIYLGKSAQVYTMAGLTDLYIEHIIRLVDRGGRSLRTLARYRNFKRILLQFLKGERELKAEAFSIAKARDLLYYCENKLNQSLVTAHRTVKNAKIILQWGLQQGMISNNPLFQWRGEVAPAKEIIYLEQEELKRIEILALPGRPGLERVRDLFLFQCYTGLDYGCTQTFIPAEHIRKDPAGRLWIYKKRAKNGSQAVVPLYPEALELLHKYQGTDLLGEVCHLPRISNQKFNQALKEIASAAGIDKALSTHVGRKTFGTLCLNKGFSIEAVSKMLGHRFIKTTETHYAQVLAGRVEVEFSQNFA